MQKTGQNQLVGQHILVREVLRIARRVAQCDLPVNIEGETGTGKELLARFVHAESPRRKRAFVAVDCGMLSCEMARSEMFGYVRGAFTGATETRDGLVAQADGGTLFLDEVGELNGDLQLLLLRLIQEGEFRRVGEVCVRRANVRVITATHRDLKVLVQAGQFREDLYYRLHIVPLTLPPLRSRQSDIPLLLAHFCALYGRNGREFTDAAIQACLHYDWPGNVRELGHEVARLMVMTDAPVIDVVDLSDHIRQANGLLDVFDLPFKEARKIHFQRFRREYIHRQLLKTRGNVTRAAQNSGLGRQYFQLQMAECGIRSRVYKRQKTMLVHG